MYCLHNNGLFHRIVICTNVIIVINHITTICFVFYTSYSCYSKPKEVSLVALQYFYCLVGFSIVVYLGCWHLFSAVF